MIQGRVLYLFTSVVLLGSIASAGAREDRAASPRSTPEQTAAAPAEVPLAAMSVSKDPVTGRLRPADAATHEALLGSGSRRQLQYSVEGLAEVPSPVSGGGTMIRLEGRFQSWMQLTLESDGGMSSRCGAHGEAEAAVVAEEAVRP